MPSYRPPGHFDVNEAAEELGLHAMTVHKKIRAGELASIKRGNKRWIRRDAVRSLKRRLERPQGAPRRLPDHTRRPKQESLDL